MKIHCSAPLFRVTLAVIAALGCIFLSTANAQRLPQTVRPEHYSLMLAPDLKAATFSGVETIDVDLAEPTDHITLNAVEIAFESVIVTAGGKEQKAVVSLDKNKQQATFTFPEKLPAGKARLAIAYTGILNNELRGFYLSKTAKRNYAVTQFEAADARRAFPCFDEPALKATYDVTLVVDSGDTAISNTSIESDTSGPVPGKHKIKFATMPKMSTYLVAFLVGDFQCTSGESDGVTIRSCSTPDKVALTPYSVDVAKYVLHYYNNYFGIPYPLKKLDLIALPDFEAGAMENFGAITYRETALLIDPKTASVDTKKQVALTIAHEMAHQWFGDLVTMQWWDNLWLNEGFATWMSNKPVAAMHPEWNIDQSVVAGVNNTLGIDAQPTTRTIRAKADTPDEINQMFDGIAYGKAAAVLLTVENYLGEETFRKGVHNYLAAHLYGNATAEDFWGAQSATSHKPVDKIMGSLVAQPGAPIVTFGEPTKGMVAVKQERFFLSPSIQPDSSQRWTIPVCFKTSDNQNCEILTPSTTKLKAPKGTLFYANAGGKGYYRSSYPPSVYAALVKQVETALTPAERISLIGDEWAQVRSNKTPIGAYLDLAAAVKIDPSADVVSETVGGITAIYIRLAPTAEERAALEAWIRSTYAPVYAKLGPPAGADSSNTREMRAQLFYLLGYYGKDPAVIAQAREIAARYLADPASIDATLGQSALSIAASNGDVALFDQLQKIYETSTNPELQEGALNLLAQFEDPVLVRRSLDYAASGKVRNQDATIQFATALQINNNRDQAWKYIQDNWEKVQAQFTTAMGAVLVSSTSGFCTSESRFSVEQFFFTHKVPSSDVALRHTLERIDGCIEFRKLQEPNLKQWLAAQPKP
ncbi:MAG: M1 family metallopeptidase [Terracidiphilus sp.]|jgi:aminopeptidase N/puromycin-sensitive aminopeptidase